MPIGVYERKLKPLEERFWANVKKTDGCWNWQPRDNDRGYGQLSNGRGYLSTYAHRYSYELAYGSIPEGLYVLHTCDNRRCVKPAHLFLGDHEANQLDKVAKGRQARAEKHGHAKLTWEQVREIRRLYADGSSQESLARKFPVSRSVIGDIVVRGAWQE